MEWLLLGFAIGWLVRGLWFRRELALVRINLASAITAHQRLSKRIDDLDAEIETMLGGQR